MQRGILQVLSCDSGHCLAHGRSPHMTMPIATLIVELAIEGAQSIKDRRQVVRSIKDKLRNGFNISVAELDDASLWNRATLGIASIHGSRDYLDGQLREVENALNRLAVGLGATVLDAQIEMID